MTAASLTAEIERAQAELWALNSVERRFAGDQRRRRKGRPEAEWIASWHALAPEQEARIVELALELARLHAMRARLWAAGDLRQVAGVRYSAGDKTKCNPASPPDSNTSSPTL